MMTLAIHDQRLTKPGPQNAALRDYDSVRRAIAFISEHWRAQPTIEAMADAAAVTPDELHHLFRRWAGLTPKAFMQALTLDHAKGLLPEPERNPSGYRTYDAAAVVVSNVIGAAFESATATLSDVLVRQPVNRRDRFHAPQQGVERLIERCE